MTPVDYEGVYNLWISCPGVGLNPVDDSKDGITRFLLRNPNTCFVAENENGIIGSIMAGNDGRRGYIYHTAVLPSCRKTGIASALTDAALDALGREGIVKVALVVFSDNEGGNAFWEKSGFTSRTDLVYRHRVISETYNKGNE